jgi:sulfate adenylyltransferase
MRTADGTLWPIPITLDVSESLRRKRRTRPGHRPARSGRRDPCHHVDQSDKWVPNKAKEAEQVFGADDLAHPAVNYLHNQAGPVYLGGPIIGIQQPVHYDFKRPPRHAQRTARLFPQAGLAQDRRVSRPATPCTARTRN